MDFYDPFYIDSQTMTEAIVKAEKIVVMSQPEYVLTLNTSQTAKELYMIIMWNDSGTV